jgi:predicted nucleic acid-binding protein
VILCDTSAWVEYDRGTGSVADLRLKALIAAEGPIAVTEPIVMEVIAGAVGPEREDDLRRLLLRFALIAFDAAADFDAAAWIYRRCRATGVTPRGMVDCMIAAVALRSGASLLAHDADLDRVARVVGIPMDRASLPAKGARPSRGR